MAEGRKRIVQFSEETDIKSYKDEPRDCWEGWDNPFNDDNLQEDAKDILSKLKAGSLESYGAFEKLDEIKIQDNNLLTDEGKVLEQGKVERVTRKSFKKSYYFFTNSEKLVLKIHKACQIGFQLYQDVRKLRKRKTLIFTK